MKKLGTTILIACVGFFFWLGINTSHTQSTTPPPAHTGAPGEATCINCHSNTVSNTVVDLILENGLTEYTPGHNYTMDLDISSSITGDVYGFQITAQDQNGQTVGEWIATNTNTVIQQSGDYLSHQNAFIQVGEPGNFQFEWISPFPGIGPISFYASTVAADGDGTTEGDAVANLVKVYQQDPTTLVQHDYWVSIKTLMEGFYNPSKGELNTDMADLGIIPLQQPFNYNPYNYWGNESVTELPEGVVDWVLVEARNGQPDLINPGTETIEAHAGFLMKDGRIMDLDGETPILFKNLQPDCFYYFAIRHRTHLDIFTAEPTSTFFAVMAYDFTVDVNKAYGTNQLKATTDGRYGMISGDYDGNGTINSEDYNKWRQQNALVNQYVTWDGDANGVVNNLDYNLWYVNRGKICCSEVEY